MPKLLRCLENMSAEDLWWRPNGVSNSAGTLILHLCGYLRQWAVSSIGGADSKRNRDAEFAELGPIAKATLTLNLSQVAQGVDEVLAHLAESRLLAHLKIQKYVTTTLQAVYHVIEHFSYHLGQILYIYKLRTGSDPQFYKL